METGAERNERKVWALAAVSHRADVGEDLIMQAKAGRDDLLFVTIVV